MKLTSVEMFVERLECDVYPITIMKYLLNRRRILSYFSKVANPKFKAGGTKYSISADGCKVCEAKKGKFQFCRQHTSITRVMNADNVAFDLDTQTYMYKNEIFRNVDGKLVIFYCPHPKLINGRYTNSKVRRVNITTVDDPEFTGLPEFKTVFKFVSSELMGQNMKCWFSDEFSIVTLPESSSYCNWCLIPNR